MVPARIPERAFLLGCALLFVASTVVTVVGCASMATMDGMAMPGGWTMSMAWMRMPGQSWLGAAATFLGMWIVMMVAMMLPSLVPMLRRDRAAAGAAGERRLGWRTALVGAGYFVAWTLFGVVVFPLGVALAAAAMELPLLARAVPIAVGAVVLLAGTLQFTAWKATQLACCRDGPARIGTLATGAAAAWREGLRLGVHCIACCLGPTAILLVVGVMDLRAMAVVTVVITLERLAPAGERVARALGAGVVAVGLFLMTQAAFELPAAASHSTSDQQVEAEVRGAGQQ